MVGEVRDKETAEIAVDAALTGHLVFTTLHTIDAMRAIARLHDLGIDTRRYSAALSLVIAQRLVRQNCMGCKQIKMPTEHQLKSLRWKPTEEMQFFCRHRLRCL